MEGRVLRERSRGSEGLRGRGFPVRRQARGEAWAPIIEQAFVRAESASESQRARAACTAAAHLHACLLELIDLSEEAWEVHHHAVAHEAGGVRVEDAGGNLGEGSDGGGDGGMRRSEGGAGRSEDAEMARGCEAQGRRAGGEGKSFTVRLLTQARPVAEGGRRAKRGRQLEAPL